MNISKIKPEEVNLLIHVLSLSKEVIIYDPKGKIEKCDLHIVRDATALLQQAGQFKGCINFSDSKIEILTFDFILEINQSKQTYKSFFCEAFLTFNNPDGSIRWFQPSDSKYPNFLTLYSSLGLKASLFKMAVGMAFSVGLQNLISQGKFYLYSKTKNHFQKQFEGKEVAVFTGTIGENRKAVATLCEKGQASHFIKIPFSEKAKQLVATEHQHLKTINQYDFDTIKVPFSEWKKGGLQLTNVQSASSFYSVSISDIHLNALKELYAKTFQMKVVENLDVFKNIQTRLAEIKKSKNTSAGNIPEQKSERLAYNLKVLLNNINEVEEIPVAYAHGDFTPWNMFVDDHQIQIYDWELAMPEQLLLYDVFHFVFQSSILVLHQSFSQIKLKIKQLEQTALIQDIIERYELDYEECYRWYLLSNCSYYLDLYLKQAHLHQQAHWLIDCWIEATNDAIKTTKQKRVLVS